MCAAKRGRRQDTVGAIEVAYRSARKGCIVQVELPKREGRDISGYDNIVVAVRDASPVTSAAN